jgi:hypothetical protein
MVDMTGTVRHGKNRHDQIRLGCTTLVDPDARAGWKPNAAPTSSVFS